MNKNLKILSLLILIFLGGYSFGNSNANTELYSTLIPKLPYTVNVTDAFKAAYAKLQQMPKADLETALNNADFVKDAAGNFIKDENGNMLAQVTVDGEKIPVLVGSEDGLEKLDNAAKEIGESGNITSFKNVDEYIASIEKARSAMRMNIIDLPETRSLAKEYAQKIGITDAGFDSWFENTFKKYQGGTLNFEAHHIIPIEVLTSNDKLKDLLYWAETQGINIDVNGIDNGMMLQKKSLDLDVNGHANHPDYNRAMSDKITDILSDSNLSNIDKLNEIKDLIKSTKEKLRNDVLLGNKNVNDIINF